MIEKGFYSDKHLTSTIYSSKKDGIQSIEDSRALASISLTFTQLIISEKSSI